LRTHAWQTDSGSLKQRTRASAAAFKTPVVFLTAAAIAQIIQTTTHEARAQPVTPADGWAQR